MNGYVSRVNFSVFADSGFMEGLLNWGKLDLTPQYNFTVGSKEYLFLPIHFITFLVSTKIVKLESLRAKTMSESRSFQQLDYQKGIFLSAHTRYVRRE